MLLLPSLTPVWYHTGPGVSTTARLGGPVELWLERSILPERVVTPEVAFDFHLDTFARWLRAAGAEARLAVVYLSGPNARRSLLDGLAARGCRCVDAPARPGEPVHPALAAHQGDHFNDTLFVVDGLETPDPERMLREIGAQISTYRRLATWVAVLVESPTALAALETAGGILRRHAHRRFVFLDAADPPSPTDPVPPGVVEKWAAEHRVAERLFHLATAAQVEPSPLDFARLARSGYGGLPTTAATHAELRAVKALWADPPRSPGALVAATSGPSALVAEWAARLAPEAAADPSARASLAMALGGDPAARFVARLPVSDAPTFAALTAVRSALEAETAPPGTALATLSGLGTETPPNLHVHALLACAAAAITAGDVEACDAHLATAEGRIAEAGLAVTPELVFEVIEKRTGLQAAIGERAHARAGLDRLAEVLPRLQSPFYAARHALARGEQMLALDAGKAREALREAGMLFHAHGYDAWAAVARAAAEG